MSDQQALLKISELIKEADPDLGEQLHLTDTETLDGAHLITAAIRSPLRRKPLPLRAVIKTEAGWKRLLVWASRNKVGLDSVGSKPPATPDRERLHFQVTPKQWQEWQKQLRMAQGNPGKFSRIESFMGKEGVFVIIPTLRKTGKPGERIKVFRDGKVLAGGLMPERPLKPMWSEDFDDPDPQHTVQRQHPGVLSTDKFSKAAVKKANVSQDVIAQVSGAATHIGVVVDMWWMRIPNRTQQVKRELGALVVELQADLHNAHGQLQSANRATHSRPMLALMEAGLHWLELFAKNFRQLKPGDLPPFFDKHAKQSAKYTDIAIRDLAKEIDAWKRAEREQGWQRTNPGVRSTDKVKAVSIRATAAQRKILDKYRVSVRDGKLPSVEVWGFKPGQPKPKWADPRGALYIEPLAGHGAAVLVDPDGSTHFGTGLLRGMVKLGEYR